MRPGLRRDLHPDVEGDYIVAHQLVADCACPGELVKGDVRGRRGVSAMQSIDWGVLRFATVCLPNALPPSRGTRAAGVSVATMRAKGFSARKRSMSE